MAHETTIGKDQRIYELTIPATPTTIWDLMDDTMKGELHTIRDGETMVLDVLDGYIYSEITAFWTAHKIGGAEEPFAPMTYAYFPFLDWHKKVLVRAASPTPFRIKLILGFISRPNY
jgi:hypothetical protein